MRRKELSMVGVDRDVKEYTLHIQTQHVILGPDHRLEHTKILVDCLTLDRGLVEAAEGMHDALFALVRRSGTLDLERNCSPPSARSW